MTDWNSTGSDDALEERLKTILSRYPRLLVAYSGGVDSTYLAAVAHDVLGENALMVLMDSPSLPRAERDEAVALARDRGWRLDVLETGEFACAEFIANSTMRCYHCKRERLAELCDFAKARGIECIAHGENADDGLDTGRVGHRAAEEAGAIAPLAEAGLTKARIRALSKRCGLPTWNKPSFACLATRFPTGTPIEAEVLPRIEAAEMALRRLGFHQYRARHHGEMCRIELAEAEFAALFEGSRRETLVAEIKGAGYRYVTLDLMGYRLGGTGYA